MKNYHKFPHYILIIEDKKSRKTLSLQDKIYSIGRTYRNSIVIEDEKISRYHATLIRRKNPINNDESYWILDGDINGNKSRNGIYINGKKCLLKELKQGDLINFGCGVNATFYSMNEWSDTITKNVDIEPKNTKAISSNSIRFSQDKIENPHKILNAKTTIQSETYQDSLTRLANEKLFRESLFIAFRNATNQKHSIGIMFLRINHFEAINKNCRYSIGDRIIQEIARRLKASVRENDIIARWKNEQFVIMFSSIRKAKEMDKISERIIQRIRQPLLISEYKFSPEFSQGIAIYPQHSQEVETILKIAETHLLNDHREKISKQPLSQLIIKNKDSKLLKIKTVLEEAIKQKEFLLYYQPQVDIQMGKVSSMEALVRWNHPRLGLIPPNKFIPLAEKTDLICSLGKWIFKTACSQNIVWQKIGLSPIKISINVSGYQLQKPSFVKLIKEVLKKTKLPPQWLELEVTEKAILVNPEITYQTLLNLKKLEISLCIDDFCSGYSSLNYLIKFPFNKIKISQSAVKDLTNNNHNLTVISAACTLAKSLGIPMIAEGVETQKQLDILKNLDCREMQGYLFSKPLSQEEAIRFLYINQINPKHYDYPLSNWEEIKNNHHVISAKAG